jgi:peptidoglycan/LPS O-acetylase OafA/YrhL
MGYFGEVLERNSGVGPGFDFLRLFLATAIVLWHSAQFTIGPSVYVTPPTSTIFPLVVLLIPLFFGLSGFLVTGSLIRLKTLRPFIAFRALRILPALVVEVTLSALLLGPIVTEIALSEYFTDSKFWKYFGSIVGLVQFKLPGVFLHNPIPEIVNGQLWTVPPEMVCYITLSILLVLGLPTRPKVMLYLVIVAGFLVVGRQLLFAPHAPFNYTLLAILCFYWGNIIYLYRQALPVHFLLFVIAVAVFIGTVVLLPRLLPVLGPPCAAYAACYVGMLKLPQLSVWLRGDYSYGIYLYGAPLQQLSVWLFPEQSWWENFVIAYCVTIGFAALSWHWIEKPALALRKVIAPNRILERIPEGAKA